MKLNEYVMLMEAASRDLAWGTGSTPDLSVIQVYQVGKTLICETPSIEDRAVILGLHFIDDGYTTLADAQRLQGETDFIFEHSSATCPTWSVWQVHSERF